MARRPRVVRTVSALRAAIGRFRAARQKVALVPTMGALHDGHLTLVRLAKRRARRVVVSIFVNPTQFAPTEDFSTYPRALASDLRALSRFDVDLVWAPSAKTMYPEGFATQILPDGPARAGLEDAARPHFFGGVTTVCAKLFLQVRPDFAIFGEKDYQQLKVVTRMVRDLDMDLKIVAAKTIREKDGLAMSSRNVYLSTAERQAAPILYRVLKESAVKIRSGKDIANVLAVGRTTIEIAGFTVDYLEARHAETLAPISSQSDGPVRLLVAARLGKTRLIDNIAV
jgi:pantoate--beta-alanine ligase